MQSLKLKFLSLNSSIKLTQYEDINMICNKCKTELNENDIFCPKCGKRQKKFKLNLCKKIFTFHNIICSGLFILLIAVVLLIIGNINDKKNRTYNFLITNITQSITNLNLIASNYYIIGSINYSHNLSIRKLLEQNHPSYCAYLIQRKNFFTMRELYNNYIYRYQKELLRNDDIFRLYDLYEKTIKLFDLNLTIEEFRKEFEYVYKEYENLYSAYGLYMHMDEKLQ